jgi:uncharacterized protein
MIYRVDVRIETPVLGTEVRDRVIAAVETLFPDAELDAESDPHGDGEVLIGRAHSLDGFSEHLFEQAILDSARSQFTDGRTEDGFRFRLKKQAAFEGVVNFAVGDPDELGDIAVDVRVQEPSVSEYIDHIAPPTKDGEPIDP